MRLNQYSDMTFAEFRKHFLLAEPQVMSPVQDNNNKNNNLFFTHYFLLFHGCHCRIVLPQKEVTSTQTAHTWNLLTGEKKEIM